MRFKITYFYLFILIILSCNSEKQLFNKSNTKIIDTLKLSCLIVFDYDGNDKFFIYSKQIKKDTIKEIIKNFDKKYFFFQPYVIKKNNIYNKFCIGNIASQDDFIRKIRFDKYKASLYIKNGDFLLFKDENNKEFVSFLCWKPYINGRFDKK